MKLFVWENVLEDYTSGIIFALAENIEEAKEQVLLKAEKWEVDILKKEMEKPYKVYSSTVGFFLYGGS